jgi:hypothetical protein
VAHAEGDATSLLFALRKFRNTPGPVKARVRVRMTRNAGGRRQIADMDDATVRAGSSIRGSIDVGQGRAAAVG